MISTDIVKQIKNKDYKDNENEFDENKFDENKFDENEVDENEEIGLCLIEDLDWRLFEAKPYYPDTYPDKYDRKLARLVKLKKNEINHKESFMYFKLSYDHFKDGKISRTNFQKFLDNNQEYYKKLYNGKKYSKLEIEKLKLEIEERQEKYEASKKAYIDELISQIE